MDLLSFFQGLERSILMMAGLLAMTLQKEKYVSLLRYGVTFLAMTFCLKAIAIDRRGVVMSSES